MLDTWVRFTRQTMDLTSLDRIRAAHDRTDLALGPGSAPLAGGTWLFSEPQPDLTELVDLTTLGWPAIEVDARAASRSRPPARSARWSTCRPCHGWVSQHLVAQCARSLVASEKIWNWATVGGNICVALPAGAMTSLAVALDATAVRLDARRRRASRSPSPTFVTGRADDDARARRGAARARARRRGARRAGRVPAHRAHPPGRSGALVVGRRTRDGGLVVTVTAGVTRPHRLAFAALPSADELRAAIEQVDDWYDDAHGAPDWRRAMTLRLAEQVREELA